MESPQGPPPPCENYGSMSVEHSLKTEYAQYFRCGDCGSVWALEKPSRRRQDAILRERTRALLDSTWNLLTNMHRCIFDSRKRVERYHRPRSTKRRKAS